MSKYEKHLIRSDIASMRMRGTKRKSHGVFFFPFVTFLQLLLSKNSYSYDRSYDFLSELFLRLHIFHISGEQLEPRIAKIISALFEGIRLLRISTETNHIKREYM